MNAGDPRAHRSRCPLPDPTEALQSSTTTCYKFKRLLSALNQDAEQGISQVKSSEAAGCLSLFNFTDTSDVIWINQFTLLFICCRCEPWRISQTPTTPTKGIVQSMIWATVSWGRFRDDLETRLLIIKPD